MYQLSVKEQLREAYQASDEDLEYVQEEFTGFCKNQQIKKALMSSVDLLKAGDFDSIKDLISTALRAGNDKNVGCKYRSDCGFKDWTFGCGQSTAALRRN